MSTVVVSPKYQVVIPQEARSHANVRPGQELGVLVERGAIVFVPIMPLEDMYGMFGPIDYEGYREEEDEERL